MQPNFNPKEIKLVIGLGNPGREYMNTYHSVGFVAIDYLNKHSKDWHCNVGTSQDPWSCDVQKLIKSEVYMNASGNFIKGMLKKWSVKPREFLIIHDDSDIELGKYKLSFGRGAAGHKGVESIIATLKTKNFWRLRIGIRKSHRTYKSYGSNRINRAKADLPTEARRAKAGEFVLKKISPLDRKILETVFKKLSLIFLSGS